MPIDDWEAHYTVLLDAAQEAVGDAPDLTFELITHRFTPGSKDVLLSWYPNTSLDMDEDDPRRQAQQVRRHQVRLPRRDDEDHAPLVRARDRPPLPGRTHSVLDVGYTKCMSKIAPGLYSLMLLLLLLASRGDADDPSRAGPPVPDRPYLSFRIDNDPLSPVVMSPDGTTLASAFTDAKSPNWGVKLWDTATGRLIRILQRAPSHR